MRGRAINRPRVHAGSSHLAPAWSFLSCEFFPFLFSGRLGKRKITQGEQQLFYMACREGGTCSPRAALRWQVPHQEGDRRRIRVPTSNHKTEGSRVEEMADGRDLRI